jgi:hypothetical protein
LVDAAKGHGERLPQTLSQGEAGTQGTKRCRNDPPDMMTAAARPWTPRPIVALIDEQIAALACMSREPPEVLGDVADRGPDPPRPGRITARSTHP